MNIKLLTEHHLDILSLKGGCIGSSESTLVKMPLCWKSHVTAQIFPLYSLHTGLFYRSLCVFAYQFFSQYIIFKNKNKKKHIQRQTVCPICPNCLQRLLGSHYQVYVFLCMGTQIYLITKTLNFHQLIAA